MRKVNMSKLTAKLQDQPWLSWLVAACGLAIAPALGMVAITGNPMYVGVAIGMLVGGTLLIAPAISIWLIIALGLGSGAIVSLSGPLASKLPWVVSLLSIALLAPSLIHLIWKRNAPTFVWWYCIFLMLALINSALQWDSVSQFFGGFKRYFQGCGLFFALALLSFSDEKINKWQKLLKWIAIIQTPVALIQLLVLVPMRGGFGSGQATDVVAGTFGGNLNGGSNGSDLILFCLLSASFAYLRSRANQITIANSLKISSFFVLPLLLGENKIVVVLLPLTIAMTMRRDLIASTSHLLAAIPITLLTVFGIAYLYAEFYMNRSLLDVAQDTIRYNFQDVGYGTYILNRFTALTFWWDYQSFSDPISWLFGHGLSASYTSQSGDSGSIAANYPKHGINLTTLSTLLWDLGIVGLAAFLAILIYAWKAANRIIYSASNPTDIADAQAIQVGLAINMIYIVYNDTLVNLVTTEVIVALMLGHLAILYRRHAKKQTPAVSDQ